MITYNESLNILKDISNKYAFDAVEEVSISNAVGRFVAEEIIAKENNPPFDNSAMDGFAINLKSIANKFKHGKDWVPVQSLISAGDGEIDIHDNEEAIEIMTGAPLPNFDFDAVVRVEDVEQRTDVSGKKMIWIKSKPAVGDNIRRSGEDTKIGDILLKEGTKISKEHLLVLASQGVSRIKVQKQVKVAILSTGKEIVSLETKELRFGQIRNSTGIYLQAALQDPSLQTCNFGSIQDDPDLYIQNLKKIFSDDYDIMISTGAISMGVHDFIRPALESIGADIHFHKCAIRPGKPILFATLKYNNKIRFIFGAPGNPVSTAVALKFFIRPFIDLLLTGSSEKSIRAFLSAEVKKPEGFKCFFKAKVNFAGPEVSVESLPGQASFMVNSLSQSNAWVVFPESGTSVGKGTEVEIFLL